MTHSSPAPLLLALPRAFYHDVWSPLGLHTNKTAVKLESDCALSSRRSRQPYHLLSNPFLSLNFTLNARVIEQQTGHIVQHTQEFLRLKNFARISVFREHGASPFIRYIERVDAVGTFCTYLAIRRSLTARETRNVLVTVLIFRRPATTPMTSRLPSTDNTMIKV